MSVIKNNSIVVAPSVLAADFSQLGQEIQALERGGADWIHIDVMDGHFVPNITFGSLLVKTINTLTDLTLDVHLMIEDPDKYLEDFRNAGADIITVHQETCPHLHSTVNKIQQLGAKAGVALNPATDVTTLNEIIPVVDLVLIMSVNPGFAGQKFIRSTLNKVEAVKQKLDSTQSSAIIEIDGGIDETNASEAVQMGCNALVSGTGVFKYRNREEGIRKLREAAQL